MYERSYYYGQHVITTYFSSSTSNFFLYLLTRISDGGEWSSELLSDEALDSKDELNSWLLFVLEGEVSKIIKKIVIYIIKT